jgi:malonyl-ACP decarboxylase
VLSVNRLTESTFKPKLSANDNPLSQGASIAGMGIHCAIGHNLTEFTESLFAGKSAFVRESVEDFGELIHAPALLSHLKAHKFKDILNQYNLSSTEVKRINKLAGRAGKSIQTAVLVALQAWHQGAALLGDLQPDRIGMVLGGHNLNQLPNYQTQQKFAQKPDFVRPSYGAQFMDSYLLGLISEILPIRGESYQTGLASASGNAGIIQSLRLIQCGAVDACLLVAPMTELSPPELKALQGLGALGGMLQGQQPQSCCRPFDKQAGGFIPGQGAGAMLLVSEKLANSSLNKVLSGAIQMDGNAATNPDVDGEKAVMNKAIIAARLQTSDINYINCHATSTPMGDQVELAAIDALFGPLRPWLNSTKSLTGHCLFSAGVIEAIATVVQLNHQTLHANLNLEHRIDANANLVGTQSSKTPLQYGLSNAFGFGGINTSIVLSGGT